MELCHCSRNFDIVCYLRAVAKQCFFLSFQPKRVRICAFFVEKKKHLVIGTVQVSSYRIRSTHVNTMCGVILNGGSLCPNFYLWNLPSLSQCIGLLAFGPLVSAWLLDGLANMKASLTSVIRLKTLDLFATRTSTGLKSNHRIREDITRLKHYSVFVCPPKHKIPWFV